MIIYKRQDEFASSIVESEKELQEIKNSQVVGNDNLVVQHYEETYGSDFVTSAKYKAEFVFNEPTTAYVMLSIYWDSLAVFGYEQITYNDPATMNDDAKKSFILELYVFGGGANIDNITAIADSTKPGTLSISKLP